MPCSHCGDNSNEFRGPGTAVPCILQAVLYPKNPTGREELDTIAISQRRWNAISTPRAGVSAHTGNVDDSLESAIVPHRLTQSSTASAPAPYTETAPDGTSSRSRLLLTVRQFCQAYPAFTQGGLRWLLYNRQENGLNSAVVKIGRRVLLDVEKFFAWVDHQNER